MIKFNAGYIPQSQANLVGFGFTEENVRKLLVDDSPIQVTSEQLDLHRGSGFAMFFYAAKDEEQLKVRLQGHLTKANRTGRDMLAKITVIVLDGPIYLFPLNLGSVRPVYIVGFLEKSFEAMRQNTLVKFRVRMSDPASTNVEAVFFVGETQAEMEEMFVSSGLVEAKNIRRLDGHQLEQRRSQ